MLKVTSTLSVSVFGEKCQTERSECKPNETS